MVTSKRKHLSSLNTAMSRFLTNIYFLTVLSFLLSLTSRVAALSSPLPISLLSADSLTMLTLRRSSRVPNPARATLRPPTREVATVTPTLPAAARAAVVTALTTLSPLLASTTSSWVCQSLLAWLSCGKKSKDDRWEFGVNLCSLRCFLFSISQHVVVSSTSPRPWLHYLCPRH